VYYTFKQLAKLIPDDKVVIVAHDWLELGMVSNLGLSNPVVQVLHGDFDYYYNLAELHCKNVDALFCVSSVIAKKACLKIEVSKIFDWRFPVANAKLNNSNLNGPLRVCFFVADLLEERKNYLIIPKIDELLVKANVNVEWFIAGGGLSIQDNAKYWHVNSLNRVRFFGVLNTMEVDSFLQNCDVMILPSFSEGLPVSVVESMKRGVVPIVPFWNGAVSDLVIESKTGFYVNEVVPENFAYKIILYNNDFILRKVMPQIAKNNVDKIFNPVLSVTTFENELLNLKPKKRLKFKAYGSRLDREYLPNFIVEFIRSIWSKK
jgi:glycosyltransferase involved in cell wall biosynthesis